MKCRCDSRDNTAAVKNRRQHICGRQQYFSFLDHQGWQQITDYARLQTNSMLLIVFDIHVRSVQTDHCFFAVDFHFERLEKCGKKCVFVSDLCFQGEKLLDLTTVEKKYVFSPRLDFCTHGTVRKIYNKQRKVCRWLGILSCTHVRQQRS